ncbi:MAG: hypothetical protein ACRBBN_04990 [Methyloligellaceae bacterium]
MTATPDNESLKTYTEWPQVDFSSFHPGWKNSWGVSIRSEHLRDMINDTPRLSHKIQNQIVNEAAKIVAKLSCKNLVSSEHIHYASIFANAADNNLTYTAGLAWHASSVRYYMNSDYAHHLIEVMGECTIRNALSLYGIIPDSKEYPSIEALPHLIEADGLLCFYNWLRKFPEDIACQLIVLLPPPGENLEVSGDLNEDRCKIVEYILSQQG